MSSDEEDEERVQLYSALKRNQKRQIYVTLSDSDSDGDISPMSSPLKKKPRGAATRVAAANAVSAVTSSAQPDVVILDDDEEVFTESERMADKLRQVQMDKEIRERIAKDSLLNQTRAIMSKTSLVQQQIADDIISLCSDEEDEDEPKLLPTATAVASAAQAPTTPVVDKGERITLRIRSNGNSDAIEEVAMHMNEPFDVLYMTFCTQQGVPRAAVQMSLDGEALPTSRTPNQFDLEAGDLIDAKVDFSQQKAPPPKAHFVRLRLVVQDKRPEVFKIDETASFEKLRASFCKKHNLNAPEKVIFRVLGEEVDLDQSIADQGLLDNDEVTVEIENYVDPAAMELRLRYENGSSENVHVLPSGTVESLVSKVAALKQTPVSQIALRIDGEAMALKQTLKYYDLEGGELIEVVIRR